MNIKIYTDLINKTERRKRNDRNEKFMLAKI